MDSKLDLAASIDKLRRDILWTRCVAGVLFLCLTLAPIAMRMKRPKTIEAEEVVLRSREGAVLARLGQDRFRDTCLTLTAQQDVSVASLCVQNDGGSSLDLHNFKNESRATLTPGFALREPAGRIQPMLLINDVSNGHFMFINIGADTKLEMGHDSKDSVVISSRAGEPKITLLDSNEKMIWSSH